MSESAEFRPELHLDHLRRVALRILMDVGLAEDAVQEAVLDYLTKGPIPRSPIAWLTGAVKRTALDLQRRQRRRLERDRRASGPEAIEDTTQGMEEFEVSRALQNAVDELPEAYRRVVIMRYWGGLTAREIGRDLGVPTNTVRTRLSRARERLWARLGRRDPRADDGGKRIRALVAFAAPSPWAIALRLVPRGVQVAAAVVGAAAIVVLIPPLARLAARALDETHSGRNPELATGARPGVELRPTVPPEPDRTAERVAEAWNVKGRLSWPLGAKARALELEVRVLSGPRPEDDELDRVRCSTTPEGEFGASLTAPSRQAWLEIGCPDPTVWSLPARAFVPLGEVPPAGLVLEVLEADARLTITVRTPDGGPLAGGLLRAASQDTDLHSSARTRLDDRGTVDLAVPSSLAAIELIAGSPVTGLARREVGGLTPGERRDVEILLAPQVALRGRVQDPEGRPVPGATVRTLEPETGIEVASDAEGTFTLPILDRDEGLLVLASAPGRVPVTVGSRRDQGPLAITLEAGVELEGQLVDEQGTAVRGASIHALVGDLAPLALIQKGVAPHALSDEAGHFVLPGLPHQRVELIAVRPGRGTLDTLIDLSGSSDRQRETFELQPNRAVRGTVLDRAGRPLPGVAVEVPGFEDLARVATDGEGTFRLPHVPAAVPTLRLSRTGLVPASVSVPPVDVALRAAMEEASELRIRVVDAANGSPVPSFSLFASSEDGGPLGRYEIDSPLGLATVPRKLSPGTPTGLLVRAPDHAPILLEAHSMRRGGGAPILVALESPMRLTGRVLDPDGGPIAHALLSAEATSPFGDPLLPPVRGSTGEDGSFTLREVPSNSIRVSVAHPNWASTERGPIEVGTSMAPLEIVLDHGARITGQLLDASGTALPREKVCVTQGSYSKSVTSGPDGRFEVANLVAGPARIHWRRRTSIPAPRAEPTEPQLASAVGYASVERHALTLEARDLVRDIELGHGSTVEVLLRPAGSGRVRGWLEGRSLPEQVVVQLAWLPSPQGDAAPGTVERATFWQGERFDFEGLEAGTYRLSAECRTSGGFLRGERTLSVAPGQALEVTLPLEPTSR
jgi:RNA polymerase sigma factor (sigma-70 family)